MKHIILFLFSYFLVFAFAKAQPIKVEIKTTENGWQLFRDNQPYYVKGAGGHAHLDLLKSIGGNSFRTWSLDNAEEMLDEAHKRGLTVMVGLWVQHERHGFDYNNEEAVQRQLDFFTKRIEELKDHPAILCWGIGNEVDLFYSNTKVWDAVQDIAAMVHEKDPYHPTTTVTAGIDSMEIALIKQNAPDIDFLSINTYGDLPYVPQKIKDYDWNGPYMITEWGPNGHWEVEKKPWGAPIEQTSSQKADSYQKRWEIIESDRNSLIGSYVFLWGQKQETTATWYGLFDDKGNASEAIDRLETAWNEKRPKNASPTLSPIKLSSDTLLSGNRHTATIKVKDRDKDKLKTVWMVIKESTDIKAGGDKESAPPPVLGLIRRSEKTSVEFVAPKEPGAYRLFYWAYDKNGHVAYANRPFFVTENPNPPTVHLKTRTLKFEY